jgi:hypothetical protein
VHSLYQSASIHIQWDVPTWVFDAMGLVHNLGLDDIMGDLALPAGSVQLAAMPSLW